MTDTREYMNKILFMIFSGFELYQASWDQETGHYKKDLTTSMIEAAGGDENLGYTLYLMGKENNDLYDMATHYGVGYRSIGMGNQRKLVNDIPPAPSPRHKWDEECEEWEKIDIPEHEKEEVIEMGFPLI